MKPLILITASLADDERFLRLSRAYTRAVETAGGIPVIPDSAVPEDSSPLLDAVGGLLLSGGGDIDPRFFGEAPIPELGEISPERDEFEIELIRRALAENIPVLAICRGVQALNVALGGRICQDIYAGSGKKRIKHSQQAPRRYPTHTVAVKSGTRLGEISGKSVIWVNSFHHQAVSELGEGLCASAAAEDGVTEAIEHLERRFCVGVQWHPEHMLDEPVHLRLFEEFVKAAKYR